MAWRGSFLSTTSTNHKRWSDGKSFHKESPLINLCALSKIFRQNHSDKDQLGSLWKPFPHIHSMQKLPILQSGVKLWWHWPPIELSICYYHKWSAVNMKTAWCRCDKGTHHIYQETTSSIWMLMFVLQGQQLAVTVEYLSAQNKTGAAVDSITR